MENTRRPSDGVVLVLVLLAFAVVVAAWPWINAALDAIIL